MSGATASKRFAKTTNRDADRAGGAGAPPAVSRLSRDTSERGGKLPGNQTSPEVFGEAPKTADGAPALPSKISSLTWLNFTCLDAPLVAVSWLWLFARSAGISMTRGGAWALFLTAWLIYVADRFGDSLSIRPGAATSLRQSFAMRHRFAWILALVLIAVADLAVIANTLEPQTFLAGAAVGMVALAYLIVNRIRPATWQLAPLKELTIGFLFAAGTTVPLAAKPTGLFLTTWFFFACVCSLNCISIAVWERELDEAQGRTSIATAFPAVGRYLLVALVLLAAASGALSFPATTGRSALVCIGASAALLATLHLRRDEIQADVRTALADLVLLTPIAIFLSDGVT